MFFVTKIFTKLGLNQMKDWFCNFDFLTRFLCSFLFKVFFKVKIIKLNVWPVKLQQKSVVLYKIIHSFYNNNFLYTSTLFFQMFLDFSHPFY